MPLGKAWLFWLKSSWCCCDCIVTQLTHRAGLSSTTAAAQLERGISQRPAAIVCLMPWLSEQCFGSTPERSSFLFLLPAACCFPGAPGAGVPQGMQVTRMAGPGWGCCAAQSSGPLPSFPPALPRVNLEAFLNLAEILPLLSGECSLSWGAGTPRPVLGEHRSWC